MFGVDDMQILVADDPTGVVIKGDEAVVDWSDVTFASRDIFVPDVVATDGKLKYGGDVPS